MSVNVVAKIDNLVTVKHVLASVFDKTGLEKFIPELLKINPEIKIFSTGGTYKKIKEILSEKAESCLTQVSDYTGQPETQGGLVKTLDFKIYLSLLTETYNRTGPWEYRYRRAMYDKGLGQKLFTGGICC
jgi:phosphoribosylaminoimidazolecarboxamide formyltransferase/IMP cyclohydrolase